MLIYGHLLPALGMSTLFGHQLIVPLALAPYLIYTLTPENAL